MFNAIVAVVTISIVIIILWWIWQDLHDIAVTVEVTKEPEPMYCASCMAPITNGTYCEECLATTEEMDAMDKQAENLRSEEVKSEPDSKVKEEIKAPEIKPETPKNETKKCKKCGHWKDIEEFDLLYTTKAGKKVRRTTCKECYNA